MNLVLDPRQFRILDGTRIKPRRKFAGSVRGERVTQAKGVSIEFADYREYAEGDDLRHLDWNVLARLGHPVTKTYRDEEDLAVHLLLDVSQSMSFGSPTKLDRARELAAALGYVALRGGDAVYTTALGTQAPRSTALRGPAAYPRLDRWLKSLAPESKAPLNAALRSFAASGARIGVVALLSDAMDPGCAAGLRAIAARGHEVWLLQVLSEPELDPDLEGDLRLLDVETSGQAEVTVNSFSLRDYRSNLSAHNDTLSAECQRSGGRYALTSTASTLESVVKKVWKREGWLS